MAVLNELGRNSAAITYSISSSGSEQYPTFALVDKWLRNDTLQGTVIASGTAVTGSNSTIFNTQVRAGDTFLIAGQLRVVQSVSSDTSLTLTQAVSPAITIASTAKVISYTLAGTANNVTANYSNFINGTVTITNDVNNTIVNGVGTYFLSDLTNSVVPVSLTGTVGIDTTGLITGSGTLFSTGTSSQTLQPGDSVLIGTSYFVISATNNVGAPYTITDTSAYVLIPPVALISTGTAISKATNGVAGRTIVINGRARVVQSIVSNTQFTVAGGLGFDLFDSNLKVKAYPRGTVTTTANASNAVTGANTNFYWDLPPVSQVWIGDELRTFTITGATAATLTDPTGYTGNTTGGFTRGGFTAVSFRKDDSFVNYVNATAPGSLVLSQELRVGDDIIINGTEMTVTQIVSDTLFRVNQDLPLIPALSTVYKKKKIHGYTLEGVREGTTATPAQYRYSAFATNGGATYVTASSAIGTNQITVQNAVNVVGNFIKIQNAGGPSLMLTGGVTVAVAGTGNSTTVNGYNTKFTTELYVGAEISVAGLYGYVTGISSDATLTVYGNWPIIASGAATPIYRTVPLYTTITATSGSGPYVLTLAHSLKNAVSVNSITSGQTYAQMVYTPAPVAGEYLEFVYSAPNKSAEATVTLTNQSLDRKYLGFRYYPYLGGSNTFVTATGGYNLVVYERWVGSYGQAGGVGINKADASASTTAVGIGQTTTVTDQTPMSLTTGGYLYLFAKPRYFVIQGKNFSNFQQPWLGCIEFERAQPEDIGGGFGTAGSGVTYTAGTTTAAGINMSPAVSPWPCFAYFHANRFPVGSAQVPTFPVDYTTAALPIHGGIFAVPRAHASSGDLVGLNAHIYTAATITTGRWGHLIEHAACGAYSPPGATIASGGLNGTTGAGSAGGYAIPTPHLGQLVPVNSNVYNSKRFMFSPVVVLGPAYDPDIRGRIFGLKVIPSGLGSLMDTVSVTVDTVNDFYDSTAPATDHWVITSPGANNTGVVTYRFSLHATPALTAQYRSLEDTTTTVAAAVNSTFINNFRFAIPA